MMIRSDVTIKQIAVEDTGRLTYRADSSGSRRGKLAMPSETRSKVTADIEDPDTEIMDNEQIAVVRRTPYILAEQASWMIK